jgi:hypothetical protein
MDHVLRRMRNVRWAYAPHDARAVHEMTERLRVAARAGRLVTYSDVVAGVELHLPNVNEGRPFVIDVHAWRDVDRQIVGDLLGWISARTFEEAEVLLSALVVSADDDAPSQPSRRFFTWARDVGLLHGTGADAELAFWSEQVTKAHAWAGHVRG